MKQQEIHIHIVAFDIPFPPIYGGVIDIFSQIKTLYEAGIKVHLHAFEYGKGAASAELEVLCFQVHYYKRKKSCLLVLNPKPYISVSRKSNELVSELAKDWYPILFEGLHTCSQLDDLRLGSRLKLVRPANIEHRYYAHLALAERNLFRKAHFFLEAIKLYYFQKILRHADIVLPVSPSDTTYFKKQFPNQHIVTLPCFHGNKKVAAKFSKGEYVLYHGDLQVAENERAAIYLVRQVMAELPYQFVVAGNAPSQKLVRLAARYPNVKIVASPDELVMKNLIANARGILLFTFQATGLKLKLLNSLFSGTPVIANDKLLHGTDLANLCIIANDVEEIKHQVHRLMNKEYLFPNSNRNQSLLDESYNDQRNADQLIELIRAVQDRPNRNYPH